LSNRLFIIGSAGIPARYGGFETFAEQLTGKLASDTPITIYCSAFIYKTSERHLQQGRITHHYIPCKANGPFSLLYDFLSITHAIRTSSPTDHFLILGIGPGLFLPFMGVLRKRKIILHVDGLEWKRSKWKLLTRQILKLAFSWACSVADAIIVDNEALRSSIEAKYQYKIALIPYGSDHIPCTQLPPPIQGKYALVIARAEPENNLEIITQAFLDQTNLPLYLISNWKDTHFGRKLYKRYGSCPNIHFIDAIYERPELLQAYRKNCSVYIHGHSAGGTNPSLVEAMASAIRIIAFDNVFNRNTTNHSCLYFKDGKHLKELISQIGTQATHHMSDLLYRYAKEHYSWDTVALKIRELLR